MEIQQAARQHGFSQVETRVNQHREEENLFARYSNSYIYNYENYEYMYNTSQSDYF
jgi:hypothetical protein